jgi:hypothetical protein
VTDTFARAEDIACMVSDVTCMVCVPVAHRTPLFHLVVCTGTAIYAVSASGAAQLYAGQPNRACRYNGDLWEALFGKIRACAWGARDWLLVLDGNVVRVVRTLDRTVATLCGVAVGACSLAMTPGLVLYSADEDSWRPPRVPGRFLLAPVEIH